MSARSGLEARYADRFNKYSGTTDEYLKKADQARKAADSLRTAAGVVDTQKENIDELFVTAELMVQMIDDFQRKSGTRQVKNIPLPGQSIKDSPGKKLGYVKLSMKFFSAGLMHFMETTLEMAQDLRAKEAIIRAIAEDQVEVPIIGRLTDIDLDDLTSDEPIVDTKLPLDSASIGSSDSRPASSIGHTSTGQTTPESVKLADKSLPQTPTKLSRGTGKQLRK